MCGGDFLMREVPLSVEVCRFRWKGENANDALSAKESEPLSAVHSRQKWPDASAESFRGRAGLNRSERS